MSQRIPRLSHFYNQLYSYNIFNNFRSLIANLLKQVPTFKLVSSQCNKFSDRKYAPFLMFAGVNCNFWNDKGIQEEEIQRTIEEFECVYNSDSKSHNGDISSKYSLTRDHWEPVIVKNHFQVWRKRLDNKSLYQYKGM